jgi:membrane fusion protein, multidrug efflux system
MALVPLTETYVVANFKETQLTHMRAGQLVRIKVDAFPEDDIAAHIESLAPASGMDLLPPDNATGNFTKIVQRVPVKIAIDSRSSAGSLLRPGMSVDVETVLPSDVPLRIVGLTAVAYDIAPGSVAAYYPEANALVPLNYHDAQSGTQSYKSVPVRITSSRASSPA